MNGIWEGRTVYIEPAPINNLDAKYANINVPFFKDFAASLPDGFTMFLVDTIIAKDGSSPKGDTIAKDHYALISDYREELHIRSQDEKPELPNYYNDTMAHEAGHHMGERDIPMPNDPDPKIQKQLRDRYRPCLMCDTRSLKILFDQTIDIYNQNWKL